MWHGWRADRRERVRFACHPCTREVVARVSNFQYAIPRQLPHRCEATGAETRADRLVDLRRRVRRRAVGHVAMVTSGSVLRFVIEAMVDAVVVLDAGGQIMLSNGGAEDL